ncbi:MAG: hypothetical protein GWN84_12460 [Gammaproteobacteria bacterium]|nr:hypothetical protein [Gammaproteobacteria bacterium]NIR83719.1 hypothetical protein [Gammaproteobacteria bacterium]NIR91866.1 hypothetical protein [Gammaproteobacteria bacterium]NIU04885.1 hypothetical protein [Gammaproteobacteria bacterium]NIV51867.1 hypothetical protein [Gammaproteobacteria bacterium]
MHTHRLNVRLWQLLADTFGPLQALPGIWQFLSSRTPVPHFGSPRQESREADLSWWHVPITIGLRAPWHRRALEHCTVHLVSTDGSGLPVKLRWRAGDPKSGVPEADLRYRETLLVPVVARRQAGDRVAVVTNETFLAERKAKWRLPPGRYHWKLEVRSRDRKWESPHFYFLRVPADGQGNGHFTLEIRDDSPQ